MYLVYNTVVRLRQLFCLAGKLIQYFEHSFTLLSQPLLTDRWTEKQIHSLCMGWRNLFSSCAVVLCQFLVLAGNRFWFTYSCRYLEYNTVVVLCQIFGCGRKQFLVLRTYLVYNVQLCCCVGFFVVAGNSSYQFNLN